MKNRAVALDLDHHGFARLAAENREHQVAFIKDAFRAVAANIIAGLHSRSIDRRTGENVIDLDRGRHADGVIVGSALVEVLEAGESPGAFLRQLAGA